jgi:hypothetical protein
MEATSSGEIWKALLRSGVLVAPTGGSLVDGVRWVALLKDLLVKVNLSLFWVPCASVMLGKEVSPGFGLDRSGPCSRANGQVDTLLLHFHQFLKHPVHL